MEIKKEDSELLMEKVRLERFMFALDRIDRKFYNTTFNHMISISPPDRIENAISFVQSGLFLSLFLIAMSTMTDTQTAAELDAFIGINDTDADIKDLINTITAAFPVANDDLRWRWSFRLVLGSQQESQVIKNSLAKALQMKVSHCNVTERPEEVARTINRMVEMDSGGAIHNTFEAEEFSEGFHAAAIIMLYFRARWRSAPTLLNGTRPFRDAEGSPAKSTRMIRINDIMRYANLEDWGCQAIEISYATPGLTLLMLIPDQTSLRNVAQQLTVTSISDIVKGMEPIRIGVSMPLYTLRMTLLLPSKLQSMGIHNLVNWTNSATSELRLSHAIQRIMFWAEAGRNAFKDDGIEWDKTPELELVVDRPYLFYVRWHNLTLMNGNFAL